VSTVTTALVTGGTTRKINDVVTHDIKSKIPGTIHITEYDATLPRPNVAATENHVVTETPSTRSNISITHEETRSLYMPQRRIMLRKHLQLDQIFQSHTEKQVRESLKY
jgi:hypothetical protein